MPPRQIDWLAPSLYGDDRDDDYASWLMTSRSYALASHRKADADVARRPPRSDTSEGALAFAGSLIRARAWRAVSFAAMGLGDADFKTIASSGAARERSPTILEICSNIMIRRPIIADSQRDFDDAPARAFRVSLSPPPPLAARRENADVKIGLGFSLADAGPLAKCRCDDAPKF